MLMEETRNACRGRNAVLIGLFGIETYVPSLPQSEYAKFSYVFTVCNEVARVYQRIKAIDSYQTK